ncbi:MAG: pyrroloquinoline quinone-dependent dehydrogenase, partial [Acidobacteriota bacterium]|nr:pyrroloquinoline quinone-dependent dehydrogenase [Acidobacteriota bacterium]
SHPDLGFGAVNYGGPVVTASGLIFIAATPDKMLRAYDTRDGEILWEAELPAAGFSTPAVYSVDGKQFVVIAAGGGRTGPPSAAEYVAFSLP